VDITMTSPSRIKAIYMAYLKDKGRLPNGESLIKLHHKCSREKFAEIISQATICVIASTYEGFPFGFAEIAAGGVLTLFPDRPWAHDTAGPGYPWIYKTEAEALTWIKQAISGGWREMVARQLAVLRTRHGGVVENYEERRWKHFVDQPDPFGWVLQDVPRRNEVARMLKPFIEENTTGFTLLDLASWLSAGHSDKFTIRRFHDAPAPGYPSISWFHRVVTEMYGLYDACDGPKPRYVKPENWRCPDFDVLDPSLKNRPARVRFPRPESSKDPNLRFFKVP
jgi:hypothetical protein